MDRLTRFLLICAIILVLSGLFFIHQPWMEAIGTPARWLVLALRCAEVLAFFSIPFGIWTWAERDEVKWKWMARVSVLLMVVLFVLAGMDYGQWKREASSPLFSTYIAEWTVMPHQWRLGIISASLVFCVTSMILRMPRPVLVLAAVCAFAYRFAPELHLALFPLGER
jgi:hypothetical protein